jgi:hypothetical protein
VVDDCSKTSLKTNLDSAWDLYSKWYFNENELTVKKETTPQNIIRKTAEFMGFQVVESNQNTRVLIIAGTSKRAVLPNGNGVEKRK